MGEDFHLHKKFDTPYAFLALLRVVSSDHSVKFRVIDVPTLSVSKLKQAMNERERQDIVYQMVESDILGEKKVASFSVIKSHVKLNQPVSDVVFGESHYFGLGPSRCYRNYQQLVLPLRTQEILNHRKNTDQELMDTVDEICIQAMTYFTLFESRKFREKLRDSREQFQALPLENQFKDKKLVRPGKKTVLLKIMQALHANASTRDLKK